MNQIFLPSNTDNKIIYETTSEYISSDEEKLNKKNTKPKQKSIEHSINVNKIENKPENKRIIINNRSILLIKGKK
jgi:hypothetical protein